MFHRISCQIQGGEYTIVWGAWHKAIGSHSTSTKPFALVLRLVFRWVFSGCFSIKSSIDMRIHRYKYILSFVFNWCCSDTFLHHPYSLFVSWAHVYYVLKLSGTRTNMRDNSPHFKRYMYCSRWHFVSPATKIKTKPIWHLKEPVTVSDDLEISRPCVSTLGTPLF